MIGIGMPNLAKNMCIMVVLNSSWIKKYKLYGLVGKPITPTLGLAYVPVGLQLQTAHDLHFADRAKKTCSQDRTTECEKNHC